MIKKLIALMKKPSRYERALTRNLYEIRSALSERNAINIFVEERPNTSWSFFTYAYIALKNDMVAHAIKVLDNISSCFFLVFIPL